MLVYNLHDSEELYRRFPAGEGRLYFVGGFAATYLRRGDIVLIPIRLGVGWRQGVNVGYMKFSHKSKWLPFWRASSGPPSGRSTAHRKQTA